MAGVKTLYKLIANKDTLGSRVSIPLPGLNVCAITDSAAPTAPEVAAYLGFTVEYATRVAERFRSGFIDPSGSAFAADSLDIYGSISSLPAGWTWQSQANKVMRWDGGEHWCGYYSNAEAHSALQSLGCVVEGSFTDAFLGQFAGALYNTRLPHGTLGVCGGDDNLISLYDSTKVTIRFGGRVYRQGLLWLAGNNTNRWFYYTPCSSTPHQGAIDILSTRYGEGTKWLLAGRGLVGGYFGIPDGLVMWRDGEFWHGIADLRALRAGLVLLCQDTNVDPATVIPPELTTEALAQPLTISICERTLRPPADCFSKYSEARGESELEDYQPFLSNDDPRQVRKIRADVAALPGTTTFARFQAERVFPRTVTATVVGNAIRWMIDGAVADDTSVEATVAEVEAAIEDGARCDFAAIRKMVGDSALTVSEKEFATEQIDIFAAVTPLRETTGVQRAYDVDDADWSWFWCYGPKNGRDTAKLALYVMRASFGLVEEA